MNFRKRARYCQWRTTSQNKNKIDKNNWFPVYIGEGGAKFSSQWRTTSQNKNKIDKNNWFPVYIGGGGAKLSSILKNGI